MKRTGWIGTIVLVMAVQGAEPKERPGGYIRILKCGFRAGDKAPMAYVELVDRVVQGPAVEVDDD